MDIAPARSIVGLVNALAARDIRLWVEDGQLKFSAPSGGFDPELRAEVVARKPELIAFLEESAAKAQASLPAAPVSGHPPLSAAEERLWFLYRHEGPSPVYNVLATMHMRERVDVAHHLQALKALTRRHEALRTRFSEHDGVPYRIVEPAVALRTPVVDLSGLSDPVLREHETRRLITEEESRLFALDRAPILHSLLMLLADDEHVMVINIHHIVTDAWSMSVLVRDYGSVLEAISAGRAPAPSAPDRTYRDFAWWQQRTLREGGFGQELDFWQRYLHDLPPLLEVPADYPRPAVKRYDGRSERVMLPAATEARLNALCRSRGVTLFMGLLAVFAAMLSRYTNRRDIAIGTAVAGRRFPELTDTVGMFTNTIVIRASVDERAGFDALLSVVREATLAAQAHQDVPFRAVVEKLVAQRSLSHTPLYQVSLALNNAAEREVVALSAQGAQLSDNDGIVSTAVKDDLSLQFRRFPAGLEFKLTYDIHLFTPATAQRMVEHFTHLLEAVIDAPAVPLRDLPMAAPAERGALLALARNPGEPYAAETTLDRMFDHWASATPDAIAVQYEDLQLSYAALARRVEHTAARLQAAGARPLGRIGLCVARSIDTVVGVLAILKTGSGYVPLDRDYPAATLDHIIDDTGVGLILAADELRPWTPREGLRVVSVSPARDMPEDAPEFVPVSCDYCCWQPAYVIYTSGSTGKPKGIEVTHRNVLRLVQNADFVPIRGDDVFSQMSNHAFDAATFEVWGALTNGARLVHVDRDVLLDAVAFPAFLRDASITTVFVTTALFNHIAVSDPTAFDSLRHLTFGGEAVNPEAVRRVFHQGKPGRLLHVYGPTENTTFSTWHEIATPEDTTRCPIGRPIARSSAYVIDRHGDLAPQGAIGELWVGGDGVANGYIGRPDLTAERFIPDPFSGEPGSRLYRTGDWVRLNNRGEIEFVGRFDHQIKIRGFRIELGEIEAQLAEHPLVRQVVVTVHRDARDEKRLVAYLATDGGDTTAAEVRAWLRERLPDYKQPSHYVCLAQLPTTPNGKIDRARLPSPDDEQAAATAAIAPRDAVEQGVAREWGALLGERVFAVSDNFFELGGHSLLAITLSVRLRDALGVELSTRDVFEHPTLEALAARIRDGRLVAASRLPPIERATKRQKTALSFMQQRLWFIEQMEGPSLTYHMPIVLRLSPDYSPERIGEALQRILSRHESIRSAFVEVTGVPTQRVAAPSPLDLPVIDLSALRGSAFEEKRDETIGTEVSRPFALDRAPLLRALLIRDADGGHVLVVTLHHIVCDGWSLGVLVGEFTRMLVDPLAELEDLPLQYGDYAYWQKTWLDGEVLQQELDYWRDSLDGAPPLLELDGARPRPAQRSGAGQTRTFMLDSAQTAALKRLAIAQGASLFMVMLAGFEILIARRARRDDIVLGIPVANRSTRELEPLIGFFANTLALRMQVRRDDSFAELLRRVREQLLEAYSHQETPFDLLVDALSPERSLAYTPLVQVVFAQENFIDVGAGLPAGVEPLNLRAGNPTAKFDLNLSFEDRVEDIRMYCEYNTDLFDEATIDAMLEEYRQILAQAVEAPGAALAGGAAGEGDGDAWVVRGFRISPEEVERSLCDIRGIAQATLVVHGEAEDRHLIAFVRLDSGLSESEAAPGALLREARARMPHYLVPDAIVPLDALPLDAEGKPDRAALVAKMPKPRREFLSPSTPTEIALAQIWIELLGRAEVGARDNFFEIGGHSLLAAQVCTLANRRFGVEMRVRDLYGSADLADFAAAIDLARRQDVALQELDVDSLSEEDLENILAELNLEGSSHES
jgi:amino acid adenylation domain-containing protein